LIKESIPYSYQAAPYLQVVTHGYRHENYELEGKKSEFGSRRDPEEVRQELTSGRVFLESRLENYFPCFVPPWNRIHDSHLPILAESGYKMLSRDDGGASRSQKAPLMEVNASLDLHTSKDPKKLSAK